MKSLLSDPPHMKNTVFCITINAYIAQSGNQSSASRPDYFEPSCVFQNPLPTKSEHDLDLSLQVLAQVLGE